MTMIRARFPTEAEGWIELTPEELEWLIEHDHVMVRFVKVRPISLPLLAQFYTERDKKRLEQQKRDAP